MIGHIAARCAIAKTKSRHPPTWWSGASSEHYTVLKSTDVSLDALDDSPLEVSSPHADDFPEPMVAEDVRSSPPTSDLVPAVAKDDRSFGLAPIPSPVPALVAVDLHAPIGGQSSTDSPRKNVVLHASPGFHSSVSFGD